MSCNLNKCSRIFSAVLIFIVCFAIVISSFSPVYATEISEGKTRTIPASQTSRTVRVGFSNFIKFSQIDKDEKGENVYSGLLYDYLMQIEKYTGWQFEFVEGDAARLLTMLENGEIDLMGGILKDKSVVDTLDFSEYSIGKTYSVLAVDEKDEALSELDYDSFQNMNVGVLKSAKRRKLQLKDFCDLNKIDINMIEYDNNSMLVDLRSGKLDAILTNDISLESDQRSILRFAPMDYYFATTKGNTEILQGVNQALSKLFDVNPSFDGEMYAKYFQKDYLGNIYLSSAERKFIKAVTSLKVAVIDDWEPISYFDDNNKPCGMSIDIMNLISQKTELTFEYVKVSSLQEAMGFLESGTVDLIAGVPSEENQNYEKNNIILTSEYLPLRTVVLKNNKMDIANIQNAFFGLPKGYNKPTTIADDKLKYYDTIRETLEAVNNYEADYMYISTYVAEYYQSQDIYKNISTLSITDTQNHLSIGIAKPANPLLLSIFDKSIHSISEDEMQSIMFNAINNAEPKITIATMIQSNMTISILIFSAIALAIIIGVFLFFRLRLKLMRQVALEGERYRILGEIADEYIYSYDFKTSEMTFSNKMCRMLGKKPMPARRSEKFENDDAYLDLSSFFSCDPKTPNNISEIEIKMADGKKEWFRMVTTVVFDHQHMPLRGMGKLVSIQREKQEKKEMQSKINHDPLTKLYTGTFCSAAITKIINAKPDDAKYALFVIDIDYFKKINDNMGHQAGDTVLCDFAKILSDEFELPQLIGRWGGDEFIVFIPDANDEIEISKKAARLCRLMDKTFTQEGKSVPISLSIGICISDKTDDFSHMFKKADHVLYKVKNERRNGFEIYKETKREE